MIRKIEDAHTKEQRRHEKEQRKVAAADAARRAAGERAAAELNSVELRTFVPRAGQQLLQLFVEPFLVGTVYGAEALQWWLDILGQGPADEAAREAFFARHY